MIHGGQGLAGAEGMGVFRHFSRSIAAIVKPCRLHAAQTAAIAQAWSASKRRQDFDREPTKSYAARDNRDRQAVVARRSAGCFGRDKEFTWH